MINKDISPLVGLGFSAVVSAFSLPEQCDLFIVSWNPLQTMILITHTSHVTCVLHWKNAPWQRRPRIPTVIGFTHDSMSDDKSDYNFDLDILRLYELVVGTFTQSPYWICLIAIDNPSQLLILVSYTYVGDQPILCQRRTWRICHHCYSR